LVTKKKKKKLKSTLYAKYATDSKVVRIATTKSENSLKLPIKTETETKTKTKTQVFLFSFFQLVFHGQMIFVIGK
jgi:hypothetical protein